MIYNNSSVSKKEEHLKKVRPVRLMFWQDILGPLLGFSKALRAVVGSNDSFLAAVVDVLASKASLLHKTAIMLSEEPFGHSECFQNP